MFSTSVYADHSEVVIKRGEPGHEQPFGKTLVAYHEENQLRGFSPTEHRVVYDDEAHQFVFQVYAPLEREMNASRFIVYWVGKRNAEIIHSIPTAYGFHFHESWTKGSQGNIYGVFDNNSLDTIYTIIHDFSPFSREIVSAEIDDFALVNKFYISDDIQPWVIRDVDSDGFSELICVDKTISDLFDKKLNKPHALIIFKKIDSAWTQIESDLYMKWDTELESVAKEQVGMRKISTCMSLMYSLFVHGDPDYISKTESVLFNEPSYEDGKVPPLAEKSFNILKDYLADKK